MSDDNIVKSKSLIRTFVIFDLETPCLPMYNFNKFAITELCMIAFSAEELHKIETINEMTNVNPLDNPRKEKIPIPVKPRIVHKLNLLFNPRMMVHPEAEQITGLNNYMLETENHFDENAGKTILGFLNHLQQPICVVAHNGWTFDFPILKQSIEKVNLEIPTELLCLDSLKAIREIDDLYELIAMEKLVTKQSSFEESSTTKNELISTTETAMPVNCERIIKENSISSPTEITAIEPLKQNETIDWRQLNETTPKRPTTVDNNHKRRNDEPSRTKQFHSFNSKRRLFPDAFQKNIPRKRYPKGKYTLATIYERIFGEKPTHSHNAEADVEALTKIIQSYGADFLNFAEIHARKFNEVPKLGARIDWW